MNIPYVMKRCTKCGEWKVASAKNFYKNKTSKCGLESQCKECKKKYDKLWQRVNRNRKNENNKQYYQDNKENIAEQRKQYCQANREKITEYRKQYYQDNKEKIAKQRKQYYRSPQGQAAYFNSYQRRHAKKEQQGDGITKDQWLEMMSFFSFRCAYSGEVLSKDTRSIDHIVPINSGGDNMIWNCVPMTRSLNSSKSDKDMIEWYKEQDFYSEARLQKIYDWQEYAYNKWGKDTQYFNTNDIQIKLI